MKNKLLVGLFAVVLWLGLVYVSASEPPDRHRAPINPVILECPNCQAPLNITVTQ